jgi:hypothetical protein
LDGLGLDAMSLDISSIVPPDDSGSDAFRRYCYQAHVGFPFCLNCALGGDVISVVPEHIEDIAVERVNRWQLIQIKTRDEHLLPWRLSHITGKGGALHSALRSHRALPDESITIEIFLEGPLKRDDDIVLLRTEEGRQNSGLQTRVQHGLQLDPDECVALLARVRLTAELPSRDAIIDRNLRLLGNQASHLSTATITDIYARIVARFNAAMAIENLEPAWMEAAFHPESASSDARRTYNAKRLAREHLQPLIGPITAPVRPLLRRITESNQAVPSVLEEKLLAGGASPRIIATAKSLRANAAIMEFENAAAILWGEDNVLDDVRERLRIRVESLLDLHGGADRPAVQVWSSLLDRLPQWADTIDGHSIFRKDPDLLLGEVCQLADLCETDWGQIGA